MVESSSTSEGLEGLSSLQALCWSLLESLRLWGLVLGLWFLAVHRLCTDIFFSKAALVQKDWDVSGIVVRPSVATVEGKSLFYGSKGRNMVP